MILAAPLVIPFAKAVGLSIGTLGMAALADQVNDYIQENPEESMKILSTIIPGVGIGQIFMSKEDKISLEDLEDMTDEEAQDLSKEEIQQRAIHASQSVKLLLGAWARYEDEASPEERRQLLKIRREWGSVAQTLMDDFLGGYSDE